MRFLILAAVAGAVALPSAAHAQYYGRGYGYSNYGNNNYRVRQERRECARELRRADSRREYRRELRECRREIRRAQRDDRYDRRDRYDRYDRYDRRGRRW